jgi:hypothetical protein
MNFQEQLNLVRELQNSQQIELDLSIVLTDKVYNIAGNYFYIFDAPDQVFYIQVKTNATNQPAINWVKQTGFIQPFTKLYITSPAGQSGTMRILIASMAPELFSVIDNRSAVSQSMLDVLDELKGDTTPKIWGTEKTVGTSAVQILALNANRHACTIQAKSTNTGIVYIGFDNTVTSTKWVAELQPGMSYSVDDYRGDVEAIATAVGQLVGYGEW